MIAELWEGTAIRLQVRLQALLTAGKTISQVIVCSEAGKYIIIHN